MHENHLVSDANSTYCKSLLAGKLRFMYSTVSTAKALDSKTDLPVHLKSNSEVALCNVRMKSGTHFRLKTPQFVARTFLCDRGVVKSLEEIVFFSVVLDALHGKNVLGNLFRYTWIR